MSIATCNIKDYRLRRLAIVGALPLIPFVALFALVVEMWPVLVDLWDGIKEVPGEIRRQWKKDFRG